MDRGPLEGGARLGGRGWWYDAAAFMALMRENIWIEVSGLPPKRLPDYYKNYDFERLAK